MSFTPFDNRMMRRALRLAIRGYTHPNPMVGCVITRDEQIIGEGWHPLAGRHHAEIIALQQAGGRANRATAYVTLEPCCHTGRTGPCADALIAAGISRVVMAVADPNPRVSGGGAARLKAAGVMVDSGLLEAEARKLNAPFFHFQTTGLPYVTLKAAMTLDGKIATRTGDSKWITGERARSYVHELRAKSGAILCGIGTVLADNPMLTSRTKDAPRQPLRVVLDSRLRLPVDCNIANSALEYPTLIITTEQANSAAQDLLQQKGLEIIRLTTDNNGNVSLSHLLDLLRKREIISLLVEGGGTIHASFLFEQLADQLLWFIAPRIVGGDTAPGPVGGEGAGTIAGSITVQKMSVRRFGPDILLSCIPQYTETYP